MRGGSLQASRWNQNPVARPQPNMTETTLTVTEPLKEHLKEIKQKRELSSLDETIKNVLDTPVQDQFDVADGNMEENPAPIKVEDHTLAWVRQVKDQSEWDTYEDVLREKSGASERDHGEQPVEWEPLTE